MIVLLTAIANPSRFARFTWSDDLSDCDFVAGDMTDDELDRIFDAKGHEGAAVEGYTVEIR